VYIHNPPFFPLRRFCSIEKKENLCIGAHPAAGGSFRDERDSGPGEHRRRDFFLSLLFFFLAFSLSPLLKEIEKGAYGSSILGGWEYRNESMDE
jgi:hypothetical protein